MSIPQQQKENIQRVSEYFHLKDMVINNTFVDSLADILSQEDPTPRDIVLGFFVSEPMKSIALLDFLSENIYPDAQLNACNLRIVSHTQLGCDIDNLLRKGESLLHDGIPGTTFFSYMKNIIEDEGMNVLSDDVIPGFITGSEVEAEEQGLNIF